VIGNLFLPGAAAVFLPGAGALAWQIGATRAAMEDLVSRTGDLVAAAREAADAAVAAARVAREGADLSAAAKDESLGLLRHDPEAGEVPRKTPDLPDARQRKGRVPEDAALPFPAERGCPSRAIPGRRHRRCRRTGR
jgi:hypothetical protein